jgi:hypothetical protein
MPSSRCFLPLAPDPSIGRERRTAVGSVTLPGSTISHGGTFRKRCGHRQSADLSFPRLRRGATRLKNSSNSLKTPDISSYEMASCIGTPTGILSMWARGKASVMTVRHTYAESEPNGEICFRSRISAGVAVAAVEKAPRGPPTFCTLGDDGVMICVDDTYFDGPGLIANPDDRREYRCRCRAPAQDRTEPTIHLAAAVRQRGRCRQSGPARRWRRPPNNRRTRSRSFAVASPGIRYSYFWYPLIDSEDAGYIR